MLFFKRTAIACGVLLVALGGMIARGKSGATTPAVATKTCLSATGVRVANTAAKNSLGTAGDLTLNYRSGLIAQLSFDATPADARALVKKIKGQSGAGGPVYALANVSVLWGGRPTPAQERRVNACVTKSERRPGS